MNIKESIADFRDNVIKLIEAKFALGKLEVQDKVEWGAVKATYALMVAFVGLIILVLLNILIAILLNSWLQTAYGGYVIMLIINVLLLVMLLTQRHFFQSKIKHLLEKIIDELMKR